MKATSDMVKTFVWKALSVPSIEGLEPQSIFNETVLVLKIFLETYFIETGAFQLKMKVLKDHCFLIKSLFNNKPTNWL